MLKFRKVFSSTVAALMILTTLSGCSSTTASNDAESDSSGGKVTLKFLHKWPQPENMPYFEAVVKEFESSHSNIKIDMQAVDDSGIKDKLRVMMGSDSQPDIFFSWSGEFAKKFVDADNVLDLSDALKSDTAWTNSFMKAGLEPFTFGGKNYGIPLRINGKFFVYNKEIFDTYNLKEPKTWDEFLQICET